MERSQKTYLSYEEVRNLIPQKNPFIFVDKVIDFVPEKSITAIKNVTGNEYFFQGHFPQEAVMPGALIIEGMAQAAIVMFKLSYSDDADDMIYLFGSARIRFIKKVVPGDCLRMELEFQKVVSDAAIVKGVAYTEDDRVAEATLTFARERGTSDHEG